ASFTNKSDVTTDLEPSNETDIHTGTLKITKTDSITGTAITTGAIFKIALTSADAKAGDFLRVDTDGNIVKPGDANYATATDITITTGADGTGSFTGLADLMNDTAATYWVSETKAPAGYNILVNPVQVVFSAATKANDWTAAITVKDSKGFTLPLTGAAGVAIFTIAGIVLVGMAVMLVVNLKKKEATDSQA
ncbi:MAG: SpaH/EbpB family LPXTG-anchored major pilin, partial [Coriobacteriia bacterium]|nr:SpaH/EbpB family LPXTG-anchored major pilin [Coriobacteriia bacterium]